MKSLKEEKQTPNQSEPFHPRLRYVDKTVTRHGKTMYYFRPSRSGPRTRLPGDYGSADFMAAYRELLACPPEKKAPEPQLPPDEIQIKRALISVLRGARSRAAEKRWDFDLTVDWLMDQAKSQGFRCAATGVPFFSNVERGHARIPPTAPSIDRINVTEGYTKANCRVVCAAFNIMVLDWGDEVFGIFAKGFLEKRGSIENA